MAALGDHEQIALCNICDWANQHGHDYTQSVFWVTETVTILDFWGLEWAFDVTSLTSSDLVSGFVCPHHFSWVGALKVTQVLVTVTLG